MPQSHPRSLHTVSPQAFHFGFAVVAVLGGLMIPGSFPVRAQPQPSLLAQANAKDNWERAQTLMQRDRDAWTALTDLNKVIQLNPKFAPAYALRGAAYQAIGNSQKAIADLNKAIQLDPKLATAYANRGHVFTEIGDTQSAIADLDKAIQLDPQISAAYFDRGMIYYGQGNTQNAIADLDAAIRLDPKSPGSFINRGAIRSEQGNLQGAIADYSKAIQLNSGLFAAFANRSEAYSLQKNFQKALSDANESILLNPKYEYGYVARGAARIGLKDYPGAQADFNRALQLNPSEGFTYYWRGLLNLKQGNTQQAISDYEKARQLSPNIANGYENYSLVARRQSQPPKTTPTPTTQSSPDVYNIANNTTVLIEGQNSGSGVIFSKTGNTYYLLTAKHVVATPDEYLIITASGKEYPLDYSQVIKLADCDLAVVPLVSNEELAIAPFGNSEQINKGSTIFVSGWPAVDAAITKPSHLVTKGDLAGIRPGNGDGYELLYSNSTGPGMSGGPIFNNRGQVIGIHGRAAGNSTSGKVGINLGIPIHLFLQQASESKLDLQKLGLNAAN